MLAITLTLTPVFVVWAFVVVGVLCVGRFIQNELKNRSQSPLPLMGALGCVVGLLASLGWNESHNKQEAINGMGQWSTLYRSVEDQHPVTQDITIKGFLATNTDLEPMTGEDFTRLMDITNGLGADALVDFVKVPEVKVEEPKEEPKVETEKVETENPVEKSMAELTSE